MEHKGLTAEDNVIKLNNMRRLRRKAGKQHRTDIDIFDKNVIDSSLIRGAFAIRRFIREKKQSNRKKKVSNIMGKVGDKLKKDFGIAKQEQIDNEKISIKDFMDEIERDLSPL